MTLVPSTRLLWLVFYTALVGVGAGPLPELAPIWLLALGGVVLTALLDAGISVAKGQPPRASIPPVTRFMRDREGALVVTFLNPDRQARRLRVALGLPAALVSREDEAWVDLPAGAERARIDWHCTPRRRGRFGNVLACVEVRSVLGLWHVRARVGSPGTELEFAL